MRKSLKINTSILFCTVFIFRVLFANAGIISSLHAGQSIHGSKIHSSAVMKRRCHFEPVDHSGSCKYSTVEICEETSDDHAKLFKSGPSFFIKALYSFVAGILNDKVQKIPPFHRYLSYVSSPRYLALQVFRI